MANEQPWVVLKYGGTSVSTRERWETITSVLRARIDAGKRPFLVCSAISGVSNLLESLLASATTGDYKAALSEIRSKHEVLGAELEIDWQAAVGTELEELERLALGASLTGEVSPRLHARVMSKGELMLTRMAAAFLANQGLNAGWRDARKMLHAIDEPGVLPARHFLSAACDFSRDEKLEAELAQAGYDLVLTQGFIASDSDGETVLLGRGGSDTSAAYFAAKMGAELLEIWTDVPGMYTANPRQVPTARLLKQLLYDEAQELATMGAKVLHPRCIDPVRRSGIPLQIRCTQRPEIEGTVIRNETPDFGAQVKAVSAKNGIYLISMDTIGMWQQVGFLADVFGAFKRRGLSIDLVATSETNVTVSLDPGANPLDQTILEALVRDLAPYCEAKIIGPCAAVSLVGQNIRAILHQLGQPLEAFEEQRIYLVSQAASDLNLTFVVDESNADRLVTKLHSMVFDNRYRDALLGPTWKELFEEGKTSALAPGAWWRARRDELVELAADGPAYVYDENTLRARAGEVVGIGALDRVFYAVKANPNRKVLRVLHEEGVGFECVSPGELSHVKALFPDLEPGRLLFTPNFAPAPDYEAGWEAGATVTLDNLHPLEAWPDVFAGKSIMVRVDPGRGRGHHKFVKTAGPGSKFGIAPIDFPRLQSLTKKHGVTIVGLHSHVGSGIREPETWWETANYLAELAKEIGTVERLNLGGGLGVPEKPGQRRLDIARVGELLAAFRGEHPEFELWMEPGRYLVAEAGVLLARCTQLKSKSDHHHYVGLEVGMNALIRPALYGAYHRIVNLSKLDQKNVITADVVGPICETGDVLGHRRRLPATASGDVFLIDTAGAYGQAMSSNYNLRGAVREVLLG